MKILNTFTSLAFCLMLVFVLSLSNSKANDIVEDFENWAADSLYSMPSDWTSNNYFSFSGGPTAQLLNSRSTNSVSNYSVRMSPSVATGTTYRPIMLLGEFDINTGLNNIQGVPISDAAEFLDVLLQFSPSSTDEAFIMVEQRFGSNPVTFEVIELQGNMAGVYSFPLTTPGTAVDNIVIIIVGSTIWDVNTELYVDELQLRDAGSNTLLIYNFADWDQKVEYHRPEGWFSSDIYSTHYYRHFVTKTTDSYLGDHAVMIEGGGVFAYDSRILGQLIKTFPLNGKVPDNLSFYYKYFGVNNFPGNLIVTATKWNFDSNLREEIDRFEVSINNQNSYTQYFQNFNYTVYDDYPDTLNVIFIAHDHFNANYTPGSILFVDELRINMLDAPEEAPLLFAPENESENIELSPEMIWYSVEYSEKYKLEISTSDNFSNLIIEETIFAPDTNYMLDVDTEVLNVNTEYFWRVRAEADGGISDWSEIWSFTTRPAPGQLALLTPEDNATDQALELTLEWNSDEFSTEYQLQLSESFNFTNNIINENTLTETTFDVSTGVLDFNKNYYWRVRGIHLSNNGDWSEIWSFTTMDDENISVFEVNEKINSLLEIYPNPTTGNVNIEFELEKDQNVRLILLDIQGKEVLNLLDNENLSSGKHQLNYDVSDLPSGIYMMQFVTESESRFNKLVIN